MLICLTLSILSPSVSTTWSRSKTGSLSCDPITSNFSYSLSL